MSGRHRRGGISLVQLAAAIVGTAGAAQVIRPLCHDPHCPDTGKPVPATCPAEHAEAWRYAFKDGRG